MESADDRSFMGTDSVPRLMGRFAAPALVSMFANALYNIVDRIFVGRIVGAKGIAAIALSFPCMLLFMCVATLIGTGASSRVSILMGERRTRRAEQTLGNSIALALTASVILTAAARLFYGRILILSGASENLYPAAAEYLSVITYGIIPGIMSFSLSYQIRACGSPSYAMGTQIIGALSNIALDALFVIGLDMGVRGAAIATVISQGISFFWALLYFWLPSAALRLRLKFITKLDPISTGRIFAVGLPASLIQLNFVFVHGLITNSSSAYGGDLAVSATGIFMSLDSMLFMPAVALAEACAPIIGFNYGAGKTDRVISVVKTGIVITTAFYLLSFTVIMLFAETVVMLFNSEDAELIRLTAGAMSYANAGIPVMSVSVIGNSLLQGLGRGREGLILAVIRFGVFLWIPLLTLPSFWGLYGVWGSFPVSDICGSAVSGVLMARAVHGLKRRAG